MASRTKFEIAALIFALLSLLGTAVGSLWSCSFIVRVCISIVNLTNSEERFKSADSYGPYLNYFMYINIANATLMSTLIIAFVFSTILMKGLLTKRSYLVKAYYIYGVSMVSVSLFFAFIFLVLGGLKPGLYTVLGCCLYSPILTMIRKTYLLLEANEIAQRCLKNVDEEKSISIKL